MFDDPTNHHTTQKGVGTNARQMSMLVGAPLRRLHHLVSVAVDMPL